MSRECLGAFTGVSMVFMTVEYVEQKANARIQELDHRDTKFTRAVLLHSILFSSDVVVENCEIREVKREFEVKSVK